MRRPPGAGRSGAGQPGHPGAWAISWRRGSEQGRWHHRPRLRHAGGARHHLCLPMPARPTRRPAARSRTRIFLPLAAWLAWQAAPAFNLADSPSLKVLADEAEKTLRIIGRPASTRQALGTDVQLRGIRTACRSATSRGAHDAARLSCRCRFPTARCREPIFRRVGGRIINGYVEPLGPAAPTTVIYRRAPGMRNFGTTVRTGFRGAMEVNGTLYCAFNNRLVAFNSGGGAPPMSRADRHSERLLRPQHASIPPPQRLGQQRRYAIGDMDSGPDTLQVQTLVAHRGTFRPTLRSATGLPAERARYVFCDPDGNYAELTWQNRPSELRHRSAGTKFSVCTRGQLFLLHHQRWPRLCIRLQRLQHRPAVVRHRREQARRSDPRRCAGSGQLYLFGPSTTEVWANAGTTPFPFQRVGRHPARPRWSVLRLRVRGWLFARAVWVADDNTVVRLNGYNPEKISPPDLDGLIEKVTDKRELEMSCFISRGHAFLLLQSLTWSWVFDLNTNKWAERNSLPADALAHHRRRFRFQQVAVRRHAIAATCKRSPTRCIPRLISRSAGGWRAAPSKISRLARALAVQTLSL